MDTFLSKRNTILIVIGLALWRLYLSATLQLHPDEAYYWLYSRRLDLGYYDHAPLVGYLIRLTTIFSSQELWVRFGGILETVIVSVISWVLSIQMFDNRKIAAASVITLNVLPLTLAGSVIMTPDNPLFLFVGLTAYFCWQIVATQKVRYWYLLGIAFGLSLLSKYTGVLIAPSLFLFILATDERRWLKTVHPYAAFLLGCAFFLPVVYWNSKHQWMSFAFQLQHGLGGETYSPGHVLTYLGGQMAVASPVLWLAGAYASVLYLFQKDKRKLFLSLTFLPTILFFAYSSLKRTAAANWPCTAYVLFGILVSHCLLADGSKKKERLWIIGVLLSLTLSLVGGLHARFGIIPMAKISPDAAEADATQFFYGWRELARELEKDPSVKVVITVNHLIVEETDYYTREKIYADVNWRYPGPNQYGLWKIPGSVIGKDGVCIDVVGKNESLPCGNYFSSVGADYSFPIIRDGREIRTYHIVRGIGFNPPREWLN